MSLALEEGKTLAGVCSVATTATYTVTGQQISSSTVVSPIPPPRVLAQGQLPNAAAVLYTVPQSGYALVDSISVVNTSGSSITVQFFVGGTASANAVTPTLTIPAGGFAVYDGSWHIYDSSGNVYSALGASADLIRRLLPPTAWHGAVNLTTVTALVTNTSYMLYLGRIGKVLSSLDIVCRVATAAVTITWAEVGVFKGALVPNGNASLTRLGFADVSASFNSTGIKKQSVALSGHAAQDDIWIAFGSQATTPYQLRAGLADDIQSGGFQSLAGRISTAASPSSTTLAAATLAVPMARGAFA